MTTRPDDLLRARPTYLDREPPPREDPPGREELRTLTVGGLSCRHPGNGRGVRGVDLDITAGTLTVIAGRVGAGKSTLVRALLGVLPADAGEVRWNGARVDDPAEFLVPPRVGYVPQVPRLFHGSLADAVRMGWDADAAAVREALELAAFGPDLAALPDGLETEVGPGGMALSGGQVKRVAIARVLLRRPALMVIDDLSAGVDVETERALWDGLRGSGAAIVAVGNGPALLRAADQILLVEDGTVAGRGTYDDLEPSIAGFSRAAAGSP